MIGGRREILGPKGSIPSPRPGPSSGWAGSAHTTWERENPARSPEPTRQHDCQASLPGAGGQHLPPGVMGADGRRAGMWPRRWAAWTPGKTHGRRGEDRRQRACPQPSPPRRGLSLQPSPPGLAASAACSPLFYAGKASSPARQRSTPRQGFPGAGSREWNASRLPRRGGGNADPAPPTLGTFPVAAPPTGLSRGASRPSRERARQGAGPASGGGACAGMTGFEC